MGAVMGVYVHIPFCERKCYYCDFYSIVVGEKGQFAQTASNYLISLRKEIMLYRFQLAGHKLNTLFIGGGTPTLLPPAELAALIRFMRKEMPFEAQPEITVEANPNSLSRVGLAALREAGVNRISLGAQAFQDSLLRALGRLHTSAQISAGTSLIRDAGIFNINLDLMFGLPGQTMAEWIDTLERAIALDPTHLSCYSLILEEDTPFAAWERAGLLALPDDDLQAEMFQEAIKRVTAAGFTHYEISNFARPGFECVHNLHYWHNHPFLALGSGAAGYLYRGAERIRYTNTADVEEYMSILSRGVLPVEHWESVSKEQEMDETMMVGMRLLAGVSEADFHRRYGVSLFTVYWREIPSLLAKGLVEYKGGRLQVTEQGLFLENLVSSAFLR